ncbi:DUF983 domain-containing protein [Alphaproteobacteria bacterium LSUCC0684]
MGQSRSDHGPLRRALNNTCPGCGQGKLFQGRIALVAECDTCGLDIGRYNAGDGPATLLIFVYGALIVPLAFVLESLLSPPLWVHAVLWGLVMLAATLLSLRPAKAFMVALQYRFQTPEI